ncbi:MAG TPA: type II secretion system protein [Smithella sp.]|nr:type II secretion system protein [Smithella sp.]
MDCLEIKNKRGFTLIEVIAALIVAGILGAMLVSFLGTGMMHSADPVILAKNGAYLNEVMESMVADYKRLQTSNPGPTGLQTFRERVVSTEPRYYGSGYTATADWITIGSGANVTATAGSCSGTSNCNLQVSVSYMGLTVTDIFGG